MSLYAALERDFGAARQTRANPLQFLPTLPEATRVAGSTVPYRTDSVLRSAGNLASNFLPAPGQSLGNFATETVRALPSGAATVSDAVGRGAIALSQGVWRNAIPTGRFVANLNPLNRIDPSLRIEPFRASTQFEKDLTGSTGQELSLTRAGRELNPFADPDAQSGAIGSLVYPALGLFAGSADAFSGGAGRSISALARNLRYVDDAAAAANILRADGIAADAAQEIAPIIANTRSLVEIEDAISRARARSQVGANLSPVDREIAAGNVRVVSRNGMETYQYKRDGKWITAPTDEDAVERFRRTSQGLAPTSRILPVPEYIQEMRDAASAMRDALLDMPGRQLMKYVSRETGDLPEFVGGNARGFRGEQLGGRGQWSTNAENIMNNAMDFDTTGGLDPVVAQELVDEYRRAKARVDEMVAAEREATRAWRAERSARNALSASRRRAAPEDVADDASRTPGTRQGNSELADKPTPTLQARRTGEQLASLPEHAPTPPTSISAARPQPAPSLREAQVQETQPIGEGLSQSRMGRLAGRESTPAAGSRLSEIDASYIDGETRSLEQTARAAQAAAEAKVPGLRIPSLEETVVPPDATVKQKVNFLDYLRTPDRVLKKIGFGEEYKALRTAYTEYTKEIPKNIEKIRGWMKEVPSDESNLRIFKYLDGEAIDLSEKEQKVALEIRAWLKWWAGRLDIPQDKQISDYITRLFDDQLVQKEFDQDLAKIITNRLPGSTYNPFTEKRMGALGYRQDVWAALDAYVKRSTRSVHMDPALEKIRFKAGATLEESAPTIEKAQWKYIERYIRNVQRRPTEVDELMDNAIKSVIGYRFGQRPFTRLLTALRRWTYRGMLGGNVSSALRNLSQGINTFATIGPKYTAIGYSKIYNSGSKAELLREGILENNFIEDRSVNAARRFMQRLDPVLFSMFDQAEKINRASAYFGAKSKAISAGKTEREAIEYAKGIVRKTQFNYDAVDQPVAFASDIVKTAGQFMTFTAKQTEFLLELHQNKSLAQAVGAYGLYGLGGLGFVYTIGQAFNMKPKELLPVNTDTITRFGLAPSLDLPWEGLKAWMDTPDRFGNQRDLAEKARDVGNSVFGLIPGGLQIKKTYQGIQAAQQGGSFTSDGRLQFEVGTSPLETAQLAVFGKNATEQAQQYFDKEPTEFEQEMARTYDRVQQLVAENRTEEAQSIVDGLTEEQYQQYTIERRKAQTERTNAGKKAILPVYQEVQQLVQEGREDEARAIVDGLSEEQYRFYGLVRDQVRRDQAAANGQAPQFNDGESMTPQSLIGTIVLYARAIGTDPVVAFDALFSEDKLRYVSGNAVVVERMPLTGEDGSAQVAEQMAREQGVDRDTVRLDHFIPLQLGGDNSRGNLRLVPTAVWEASTPVENALGQAVREERMSAREARQLIRDFKEGRVSAEEVLGNIPAPTSRGEGGPSLLATLTGAQTARAATGVVQPRAGVMDVLREVPGTISRFMQSLAPKTVGEARATGMMPLGISPIEWNRLPDDAPMPEGVRMLDAGGAVGSLQKAGSQAIRSAAPAIFEGFTDLSTKLLEKLKGKSTVSRQFISDLTNTPDIKQSERDLIRTALADEGDQIDVPAFAEKVKAELLPLSRSRLNSRYENINLPDELRGPVANYSEHIYRSPVKTSAGDVHFSGAEGSENYFGHTRVEEMAPNYMPGKGKVERTIEVQSDLFQKRRLDDEFNDFKPEIVFNTNTGKNEEMYVRNTSGRNNTPETITKAEFDQAAKLSSYRNNAAHFRMIREDIKSAAERGVNTKLYPTGETAMKIEGLGNQSNFFTATNRPGMEGMFDVPLKPETIKVGEEVYGNGTNWIITDVLGDGKFKAVYKEVFDRTPNAKVTDDWGRDAETFDISGKVDTENPIYKFYEKEVGKYLKNKYSAQLITDPQGVKWWEVPVSKEAAKEPVLAYGRANTRVAVGVGAAAAAGTAVAPLLDRGRVREETKPVAEAGTTTPTPRRILLKEGETTLVAPGIREPSARLDPIIRQYEGKLEPGMLRTILMMESDMAENRDQYNPSIGKFAWLAGLTEAARAELKRLGKPADFDTREGALQAAADYFTIVKNRPSSRGKSLADIYFYGYGPYGAEGQPEHPPEERVDQFNRALEYYSRAQ